MVTQEPFILAIMVFMALMFKLYATIGLSLYSSLVLLHLEDVATKWHSRGPHNLHGCIRAFPCGTHIIGDTAYSVGKKCLRHSQVCNKSI
jgi:hypothetical protein